MADIINTFGNDPGQCGYWSNTAVFVVWDDWGGFWDHISPSGTGGPGVRVNCDNWGCGYVYGFRVPLLVVSAYTPAGYVSGKLPSPGETFPYVHDFGSILAFIEHNFNLGFINPNYEFADFNAPDRGASNVPLADFFPISPSLPRQFQPITIPAAWQGYDANYFLNYNGPIMDPDNDVIDND